MARSAPVRLPLWMVLLLAVCLFCLAFHFYAESLDVSGLSSSLALTENAGHPDDHFVLMDCRMPHLENLSESWIQAAVLPHEAEGRSPLLPPPNF